MELRRSLSCREGFPTITKQRILGGQQQMLRLDRERLGARAKADYERLVESVLAHLPGCDAVVLSDYAKGALTPEVCQAIIQAARRLDIPVLVDPKSADFRALSRRDDHLPEPGRAGRGACIWMRAT